MSALARLRLPEIEEKVCDIAAMQVGMRRDRLAPSSRLAEDLNIDSLDIVELVTEVETAFDVSLPDPRTGYAVYKTVFTRHPFRLADLAELVYLRQGFTRPDHGWWHARREEPLSADSLMFSQLDGRWGRRDSEGKSLFERLEEGTCKAYRRRSDGMRCVELPSATVELGDDSLGTLADERPRHVAELDSFLIDAEPVSTTAYCRFLNSVEEDDPQVLRDWLVLEPQDDREEHMLVRRMGSEWRPVPGTECWPMILVSWYGANAYSLWVNGRDWQPYRGELGDGVESFLPSEAQWEYAARGSRYQVYPWGDETPSQNHMRFGRHRKSATYQADTLPMARVNDLLGMSPFGLHHMAGNVWQWCRDWYEPSYYTTREASGPNPVNRTPSQVRSERGGSWIGPAELCRSSYRRGRPPLARGRCLGFRCVSVI